MICFYNILKKWAITGVLLSIAFLMEIQSQSLQFFHLTEKDGLENYYTPSIAEDKKTGFLWFGNVSGIFRYDGENMVKVYPLPDDNIEKEYANYPFKVQYVDARSDVWFYDGAHRIKRLSSVTGKSQIVPVCDGTTDSVVRFHETFYEGGVYEDKKGRIWANTSSHGLLRYDVQQSCFHKVPLSQKLPHPGNTGKIFEDDEGWLWFANALRPVRYNPETGEVWFFGNNPKHWPVFDCKASVFFIDSRGKMWLSEFHDGTQYDLKSHQIKKIPEIKNASSFTEDQHGRVWFGRYYNKDLTCYDPDKSAFETYKPDNQSTFGLRITEWVHDILLDKNGLIWVLGTTSINAFNPDMEQPFTLYQNNPADGDKAILKLEISDIYHARDGNNYLSYWSLDGGIAVMDSNLRVIETWGFRKPPFGLINNFGCWNTMEDASGRLFFSQQQGNISIFDPQTHRSKCFKTATFKERSAQLAIRTKDGDIWWGLWREAGLARFDSKSQTFLNYSISKPHGMVNSIVETDSTTLWLGTETGLFKFDRKSGRDVRWFQPYENPKDTLSAYRKMVGGMVRLNDSTLIGTYWNGLFRFDTRKETIHIIKPEGANPQGVCITSVFLDGNGAVVFGCLNGFGRYWPGNNRCSIYSLTTIVQEPFSARIFPNSLYEDRFMIGAQDKFIAVNLKALQDDKAPLSPRITMCLIDGDSLRPLGPAIQDGLKLSYRENYFRIYFSSMKPFNQNVKYSYRIRGLRDQWSSPSQQPYAGFTGLPPGIYTFEVRALYENGLVSEISQLSVYIKPPYWQTWWFRAIVLLIIIYGVYLLFRYQLRQRLKEELLRQSIARDLHDDLGSTLSTISILSELAGRSNLEDKERLRLSSIGEKARAAIDSIGDIVWAVNPENDTVESVIARMRAFAGEVLENKGITFHFEVGESVAALPLLMEKRRDIYLIFKEAINNCAKHSAAKKVNITITLDANVLSVLIHDNGNGFDPAAIDKRNLGGNGLRNMQTRAAGMGGTIDISSKPGHGSKLLLQIPV